MKNVCENVRKKQVILFFTLFKLYLLISINSPRIRFYSIYLLRDQKKLLKYHCKFTLKEKGIKQQTVGCD